MSTDATPAISQGLDAFIEEPLSKALASSRITSKKLPVARHNALRAVAEHSMDAYIETALAQALGSSQISSDDVDAARGDIRRAVADHLLSMDATEDILSIDEVLARELATSHVNDERQDSSISNGSADTENVHPFDIFFLQFVAF